MIVHATLDDVGHPVEHPTVLTALARKYHEPEDAQYLPPGNADFDVLYAVRPCSALLWRLNDYENSQERWHA